MGLTLIFLALASLSVLSGTASAAAPRFGEFNVSLWPEYDDPRLLTIFDSTLDSSVRLPYRFSYDLPVDAQVNMACQLTPSGQHQ